MHLTRLVLWAGAGYFAAGEPVHRRLNNGLGKTPALGWNSWVSLILLLLPLRRCGTLTRAVVQNVGGCTYADANTALQTAHLFVTLGLNF